VAELTEELPRVGRISFARLTEGLVERLDVIVRFLAVLELYKQGVVDLDQIGSFAELRIRWTGGDDGAGSDSAGVHSDGVNSDGVNSDGVNSAAIYSAGVEEYSG
jgi:segregation and condensation protein A